MSWLAAAYSPIRFIAAQYSGPFLAVQVEPREAAQFLRQFRMRRHRQLRVMIRHRRARAAAAAVAKQRQVFARLRPRSGFSIVNMPNSTKWFPDPLVPSWPRALSKSLRVIGRDIPIGVQHIVLVRLLKRSRRCRTWSGD